METAVVNKGLAIWTKTTVSPVSLRGSFNLVLKKTYVPSYFLKLSF
jgi:hypothetical protein